jgi:hypothetical protein
LDGGQAVNESNSQKSGDFALKPYAAGLWDMFAAREKRLFTPVDKPVNSLPARRQDAMRPRLDPFLRV